MPKSSVSYSRRNFLSSCGACAACMALKPLSFIEDPRPVIKSEGKMKIKILYALHGPVQDRPDWPNLGFDFKPAMAKVNDTLKSRFPDYEFIPALVTGSEDTDKIIAGDANENIEGYIVYQMNCWNRVVQSAAKTGKPVLYVDFQFGGSGGFLVYMSSFINNKAENVGFVASSRMEDLLAAVGCFEIVKNGKPAADFVRAVEKARLGSTPSAGHYAIKPNNIKSLSPEECTRMLAATRIIAVRDQNARIADPVMGIPVEYIPFAEVNDAWSSADKDESAKVAAKWRKKALEVNNVSDETLLTSAAMFLGIKKVLQKHNAGAITINCLGGFYGGHIHAYPCLGFYELNNEGLVGACECDVNSTATMLAFSTMTQGRPGFISDPDDRACRTKLCAEPVGDLEKLFTMWEKWGWHRVTFYGDLKEPVYALAGATGWKVIEES